jgi:hypothetical protein
MPRRQKKSLPTPAPARTALTGLDPIKHARGSQRRGRPADDLSQSLQGESGDVFLRLIQAARPIALRCLGHGLNDEDGELFEIIKQFAEPFTDDHPIAIADDEFPRVIELALRGYVLGVAVGLLLNPLAFQAPDAADGGAR